MKNERGSATLLMVTLAAILAVMVLVNGNVIHQLRQELRRIDHQQQQRLQQGHGQNPRH
jgi:type II secretory pathway component PulK